MARLADASGEQADSYLICATPRTGSSLLCGLLDSTGIAGHPQSYFRQPDERSWAARWGIASPADGSFSHSDYVAAALAAGRTGNGIFAVRIMWGTVDELTGRLAAIHPGDAGSDIELLSRAFGRTRYVYLRRDDILAQAVSWLRAEQTGVWLEAEQAPRAEPGRRPRFDHEQIRELVWLIKDHDAAWRAWFAAAGIRPHLVRYEGLAADPAGTARGVLGLRQLPSTAARLAAVSPRVPPRDAG